MAQHMKGIFCFFVYRVSLSSLLALNTTSSCFFARAATGQGEDSDGFVLTVVVNHIFYFLTCRVGLFACFSRF